MFLILCVLSKTAEMIEAGSLQVDFIRFYLGQGSFGKNLRGDVLYRRAGDLMNEADIPVLARGNTADDLTPGDFRIDDCLSAAPSIVNHDNEILHWAPDEAGTAMPANIPENRKEVKSIILKNERRRVNRGAFFGVERIREGRMRRAPGYRPPFLARFAALARMRWIWPRGRVTKISPTHSGFTPLIALALKLTRLTTVGDFPFSMVFR